MAKCNSHTVMVKSCFVPGKYIVHSEFLHKTQIYAIILKSFKNAYSYFLLSKNRTKFWFVAKNTRKGEADMKKALC